MITFWLFFFSTVSIHNVSIDRKTANPDQAYYVASHHLIGS